MGAGIAEVSARAGVDVLVYEPTEALTTAGRNRIAKFQKELASMGFKFQFITLAGFHALNYSMFDLAYGYARNQMTAYVELQEREFEAEERGYTATKHQREVGAGYFDRIATTVDPTSSTTALTGSTEEGQFH